jgi:hypothetical protein
MTKFLVETVSMFRMRYVIEANNAEHAKDEVTANNGELYEFSQLHVDEMITSVREIDQSEYLRQFDEDNEYLKEWADEDKLSFVNVVNYSTNPVLKEIDPSQRDWEYDGCGIKVWKGTMERYDK